ncbi:MAG: tRNA glutamyl-Q(34) synthetase GluQRS [Deltaproteobacteria bacterium]
MSLAASIPVGRLAPSPSGRLHLGHARTFALGWAHSRSRGGRLVLRLEDLDQSRCRPEHVERLLRDLTWLGLDWDGAPLYQSQRLDVLREAVARLERSGEAYRCTCRRVDLEQAVQAPQRGASEQRYPGTCRPRVSSSPRSAPTPMGKSEALDRSALRFRVPDGPLSFVDGLAGPQSFDVGAEVGDFLISSRANVPAYQLAVVVDDAYQGVTEVFRGDDLLSSTPRQILLQKALGLAEPAWFHIPLVLDAQGRRLAKRADDLSLEALRDSGVDARAVLAWVGRSAGLNVPERITSRELVAAYDLTRLRRASVSFVQADLDTLLAARVRH